MIYKGVDESLLKLQMTGKITTVLVTTIKNRVETALSNENLEKGYSAGNHKTRYSENPSGMFMGKHCMIHGAKHSSDE